MGYTLDLQKIADELDFDLEDVEMLLEVFLESTNDSMNELKSAIEANDFELIYILAHAIKGSAANLTLKEIFDIALEMEQNARNKKIFDYQESYKKLEELLSAIEN